MDSVIAIKSWLNKVLSAVCALLLAFMTLLASYQVFMRYVMKNPSTMSEDILSYSFVWLSLLATALVFGERDHMKLTFFINRMRKKTRLVIFILTEVLIFSTVLIIFIFGGKGFMDVGVLQVSPTLGITMDWIYSILPISGILILVYNIANFIELFHQFNQKQGGE